MFNSLSVLTLAFKRVRDRLRSTSTLSIHLVFILGLLSLGCQSAGGPGLTLGGSGGSTGGNVYLDGGDGAGSDAGASGATGDEGAIDLGDGEAGGESGSDGSAEEEVSGGSGEAMPPVSIPAPGPMMNGALVAAAADASGNVPVFTTSNPWEASNFEGKQVIVSIDALEEVVFFNQNKTQKLAKNINKKLNDWTTKLFNPAHAITPWGAGTEGHYRANVTRQVALKTDWIPVVHFDDYDVDYDEVEAPSGAGDIEDELAELADRPEFCDAEENYGYIHCCEEQVNVDGTFSCVFPYGDIDADLYENINLHVYLLDGDEIVEGPYQEAPNRNLLWLNRAPQQIAGASTALGHRIHALTQGAVAEIEVEVDAELGTIHKVSGDHTKAYAVAGIAADNAAGLAVSSAGKVALLNRVVDGEDVSTPVDLYADLRRQGADDGENNFDDAVRVEPFSREFTKFKYLSYQDEDLLMVNFVNDDPHPMNKLAYIDSNNIVSEFFMPSVDEARSHKELIASDVQYHDGFETTFGVMIIKDDLDQITLSISGSTFLGDIVAGTFNLSDDFETDNIEIYIESSEGQPGLALFHDTNSKKLGVLSFDLFADEMTSSLTWIDLDAEKETTGYQFNSDKSKLYLVNSGTNTIDAIKLKDGAEWIDPEALKVYSAIDLSDHFTKDLEITANSLQHHQLEDGKEYLMVGLSGVNSSLVIELEDE